MKRLSKIMVVVAIIVLFLAGCSLSRLCKEDCGDMELSTIEEIIDSLEATGKIRRDQALARKKGMRMNWKSYINGHLTCDELCQKAMYHTDSIYQCH